MFPDPIISIPLGNGKPLEVYMYGVMIALGILACFAVLFLYTKKFKIDPSFTDFLYYNGIVSIILGFLSAAVFQATYNYIEDPSKGFHFGGGITFIGGLIGGAGTFLIIYAIFRKRLKGRLCDVISIIPCSIIIAHAIGRLGCFCAGCCYGKPTDSFLGIKFPNLPFKVHPTMLYESFFLFALFTVCTILLFKYKFRHNMSLYLVCYGIFRFCIEYLRDDARGQLVGGLSPSQFWSILMVVLGIGLYFYLEKVFKKRDIELAEAKVADSESSANAESESSDNDDEISDSDSEEVAEVAEVEDSEDVSADGENTDGDESDEK